MFVALVILLFLLHILFFHSIYIEIEAEISCIAYEEKEIMIIEDMYCPGEKIEFDQKNLSTTSNKKCYKNKCNVREKINIPELDQGRSRKILCDPSRT